MAVFYSFANSLPMAGLPAVLDPKEFHHLFRVLRATTRDEIHLFDGRGAVAKCKLQKTSPDSTALFVENICRLVPPRPRIHLLQGITKGPAMDLILRQATELGGAEISPLESDFSEIHLPGPRRESRRQRWQTLALEACKQSKNPFLPEITPIRKLAECLAELPARSLRIVASLQPHALTWGEVRGQCPQNDLTEICIAIGPEGDFSPREYEMLKSSGFLPLSLGEAILTTETAAITLLGAIRLEMTARP